MFACWNLSWSWPFAPSHCQGVYVLGEASDYGEMVGRHFALTFEIVDRVADKRKGLAPGGATGNGGTNKPYQVCKKSKFFSVSGSRLVLPTRFGAVFWTTKRLH